MSAATPKVIAIVGPTASGKSALAMRAALRWDGEIVSADSRQVYRGLDLGTAKATAAERRQVPHHLIDVADPEERYDLARYQLAARAALAALEARGRVALVVGGTGLYIRALLDGLALDGLPRDAALRSALEADALRDGGPALHERLRAIDPGAAAAVDARNIRRTVRYLEVATLTGSWSALQERGPAIAATWLGLAPPRAWLDDAIDRRVRQMVDDGVLDEARALVLAGVDPTLPSFSAHGYVHWAAHLRGALTLEEAIRSTARDVRAYSRRQMTWFRRDGRISWVDPTTTDVLGALEAQVSAR
ncbi:MAG: tRNA (adenosine(37)-N6)-dimethylallyltransferase MiaA [Chloroflexi bacterium]|nr:tRNA (adenosine(37)-N6)-dimethylallyltransferase MiaA [Chloroflexota bacterium]